MVIDTSAPVLVIYRGGYGAVAVARTLGRLGVPVHLVAQEGAFTPVWSSRYWRSRTRWDFSRPEDESVEFLLDLGARLETTHGARPLLLTLADWVAIFIERNSHLLQGQFVFPNPAQPVLRTLANKWSMHLLATEHSIPTPTTACPSSSVDVEEFLETSRFPIVMKAADPFLADPPAMRITHSRRELLGEVDRDAARGPLNVVLQEYIPGEVDSVWMCNAYVGPRPHHNVIFTGKKLRQVSPTGIASLAVCLPNETVAAQTRDLLDAVGYRGCVGIGYRYDRRDGLYKLLDVNARLSGVFRLFAGTNEMDVVRVCYLDLTGQPVPATALQGGRKWMLERDVIAAFAAMRSGHHSLREWMRSLRGVRELHWAAADDPRPVVAWLSNEIRRRAR